MPTASPPLLFAGIDIGSTTAKAVIIDHAAEIHGRGLKRTGASFEAASEAVLNSALEQAGASRQDLTMIFSTGYGRTNVPEADQSRTEIACHGRGAYHVFPKAITVVDIGGQDNKVIELDDQGHRTNFKMNRKCAAGTGAFIEEIARRLDVSLEELSPLADRSSTELVLNSFCTVFAATEVLSRIREGIPVEDLARAAFRSVVRRVVESHPLPGELVLTGGVVAHNPVVAELIEERTGRPPLLPPDPQLIGALGAALLARQEHTKNTVSNAGGP